MNDNKQISDFNQEEMMEFINCLNACMQEYDRDIEFRMKQSEKIEWNELKKHNLSNEQKKHIYHMKNIKK